MQAETIPVVVDVARYTGSNRQEILDFTGGAAFFDSKFGGAVQTIEGVSAFAPGDFIVRGPHGNYFSVAQDVFYDSYKIVSS